MNLKNYGEIKLKYEKRRMKEELKVNQEDRTKVVTNYYKASNALMEIGTTENIPEELKQLAIKASSATTRIIDYINSHREYI